MDSIPVLTCQAVRAVDQLAVSRFGMSGIVLMENAGHPVTRTMIIERVWDRNFDSFTNVVDVHVSRLRAKVDRGFDRELIRTIKGVGYVLTDED